MILNSVYQSCRKLFVVGLAISTFCFCSRPGVAHAIDLYAMGSYWEIEDADGSWGAGLGLAFPLLTERLRFDARAYVFENSDIDDDDELEIIPIDFGLQIHLFPDRSIDPYILGGASWVYADADRVDVDNGFGGYVGAGVDFGLIGVIKPFGEVVYRYTELDTDRFSGDDLELSGITANIGLKIHL